MVKALRIMTVLTEVCVCVCSCDSLHDVFINARHCTVRHCSLTTAVSHHKGLFVCKATDVLILCNSFVLDRADNCFRRFADDKLMRPKGRENEDDTINNLELTSM